MKSSKSINQQPTQSQETTAKNNSRRQEKLTIAQDRYVVAVQRALLKFMLRHFAKASMTYYDPYDLASFAVEKVLKNLSSYMERYPDPVAAAHAVARNAAWDYARRIRAQRGEGAKGERPVLGLQAPVTRGDEDSPTWEDMLESTFDQPEDVAARIDMEREIDEALGEFSPVGLDGALAGEIDSRTQGDVAKQHGVRRETVNRATKNGRKRASARRAAAARDKERAVAAARRKHDSRKNGGRQ